MGVREKQRREESYLAFPYQRCTNQTRVTIPKAWLTPNVFKTLHYIKSEAWFIKAAEAGNLDAMNVLAKEYLIGSNFKKDDLKAFTWFRKSAEEGYTESYDYLAMCYEYGVGVKMNSSKAVEWYKKAIENDNEESMYRLGFLYEMGNGVPKDDKKAFGLYKKSAEKGNVLAQLSLSFCYFDGIGTQKDRTQAIFWAAKARDAGLENAGPVLENMKELIALEKNYHYAMILIILRILTPQVAQLS